MKPAEFHLAVALGRCSFLPGSWDKRFCRAMASLAEHSPDRDLTERQAAHLLRLSHKYRRQLPVRIIEMALDEMVDAADRRVAAGAGALPDFTPARRAVRREKAKQEARTLPLFDRTEAA